MPIRRASFRPYIELLEDRQVPASHLNAFARFRSEEFSAANSVSVQIRASDFTMPSGVVRLGAALRADGVDPAPASFRAVAAAAPVGLGSRDNLAGETG